MSKADELVRFEAVVLPHLDAAYNLARWLTGSADQAQDVAQEATLRAWRFWRSFRGGDARPWFLRIVRNTFLSSLASTQDNRTISLDELGEEDGATRSLVSSSDDPEIAIVRLEERAALDRLIAELPFELREVLVLRELEELSYKEIAVVADIPIGTVMSRLSRARSLLLTGARAPASRRARHAM